MPTFVTRSRRMSTMIVAVSAMVAGLGSYVLLIVVAKNLSTDDYASFAVFWSIATVAGLGVYFPVEQETARDFAGRDCVSAGRLSRVSFGFSALVSVVLVAVAVCLLVFPAGVDFVGSPGLVIALCATFVGYLIQFPTRGLLSGARKTEVYSAILAAEGALRIVVPLFFGVLGVRDPFFFALAVGVAAALSVIPGVLPRFRVRTFPHASFGPFALHASQLIVAALAIQLLINSSVLIARSFDASEVALAGQILTCLAVARVPVFVYQVAQVLYMPHLATAWKKGEYTAARKTILLVSLGTALIGVFTVVGMVWLGPWVIGVFFTPELLLPTGPLFILAVGVSLFLLAQVLSDAVLACGGHGTVLVTWLCGVGAAALSILFFHEPAMRAIGPLAVGALCACVLFAVFLAARFAGRAQKQRV